MKLESFELRRERGDDPSLTVRGEVRIPPGAEATVVICHGFKGFARFAFFPYLAEKLAAAGLRAITFDFSGSGIGPDRENFTNPGAFTRNTYLQELEDLDEVVAEARALDWIDDRYGLFGHSRGGGIAILQAARDPRVQALVTWAAISSTNRWPPEVVEEWRQRGYVDIPNARTGQSIPLGLDILREVEELGDSTLDIGAAAARIEVPWLILHGTADETLSVSEAELLAQLSGDSSTLRLMEGASHTFGGKHPLTEVPPVLEKTIGETVDFFVAHLVGAEV